MSRLSDRQADILAALAKDGTEPYWAGTNEMFALQARGLVKLSQDGEGEEPYWSLTSGGLILARDLDAKDG